MGSLWLLYTFLLWELLAQQRNILVKDAGEWQQRRLYWDCYFCIPPSGKSKSIEEEKSQRNSLLV